MIHQINVQLFARLRELHGSATATVPLPKGSTVAELRKAFDLLWHGELRALAQKSAVAVNGEYASDESVIERDDEVALIPPVSGG
jgi:molybdopterin converting factor subunit 1